MNLNIKTKIILNAALVIVCSILLFTAIVSIMLWEQTERKAHSRILSAVNIIAERLEGKSLSLKDTASKIASKSELANLINFIQETSGIQAMEGMIKNERKSLALSLYSIALTTGVPKLTIYGTNEKWISHIEFNKNTARITIPANNNDDKYLQAEIIKGNMPADDQWKEIRIAPIPSHIQSHYPHLPQSSIVENKNRLWITSQAPLQISTIDVKTLKEHKKQVGAIDLRVPFGNTFTNDIYKLTDLKTNLYINNRYVAGNIPTIEEIEPKVKSGSKTNTFYSLISDKTIFDVTNIYDQSYFRGVIPLASNGRILGHFAIFLSQKETQSNLNHIIKTLLLAAILVIVISIIISLLTAKSIAKPILELIRVMRQVEEKGDFSIRAKSDGISEIALAGRAFNSLIEELQYETSGRKNAETKLADNSVSIEDKIASRTTELERKTHELARSNKNISSFLMTMSHEIRGPMNGTVGMLQLLSESELDLEQQELVDIANNSGMNLVNIVDDVLELSQIASGKIAIENIPFNIRVLLEDIVELLNEKAGVKMLDLSYLISSQIPEKVNGDPTKIRQILNHLLTNIIKITEQGEILINVSIENEAGKYNIHSPDKSKQESPVNIAFEIYDSGVKPGQARKQVIDSIDLATGENKLQPEETGLGISICNQLVSKLGGKFEITKSDDGGSCFVIILPFSRYKEDENPIDVVANLNDKKILLVDSMPANSLIIQQHLMQWDIDYQATSSESEAKQILLEGYKSGTPFDLILIDIQSPQIQGLKLSSWISSNQNLAHTKQVLITLKGFKGDASIARNAGISGYLSTPIKVQQLHKCLLMIFGLNSTHENTLITKHSIKEADNTNSNKVLLIDYDLNNLKTIAALLKSQGIIADTCTDGEMVSKSISANSYSLIIMKADMPVINVIELSEVLKRLGNGKNKIPIYATIDKKTSINTKELESCGISGILKMPVDHSELRHIIESTFDIERLIATAEQSRQRKMIMLENAPDALDIGTILSLRSLIPQNDMEKFIVGFFEACQTKIKRMELAYETGDNNQFIFIVHSLKRSCANLGATKIAGLCHLLDHNFSKNGFSESTPNMIDRIECEINNLKLTLPKELGVFS